MPRLCGQSRTGEGGRLGGAAACCRSCIAAWSGPSSRHPCPHAVIHLHLQHAAQGQADHPGGGAQRRHPAAGGQVDASAEAALHATAPQHVLLCTLPLAHCPQQPSWCLHLLTDPVVPWVPIPGCVPAVVCGGVCCGALHVPHLQPPERKPQRMGGMRAGVAPATARGRQPALTHCMPGGRMQLG